MKVFNIYKFYHNLLKDLTSAFYISFSLTAPHSPPEPAESHTH